MFHIILENENIFQIDISEPALQQIHLLKLKSETNKYFRIGVKSGGCNGFMYFLRWDETARDTDLHFKFDNISVIIDRKSIVYINNLKLDYQRTLRESGFIFNNPNANSECGCSMSFDNKGK